MAKNKNNKPDGDNVFESSLEEYQGEGKTAPGNRRSAKRRKAANIAYITVICICAAVLAVCIVLIAKNLSDKERGRTVYDEAAQMFDPEGIFDVDASQTKGDEEPLSLYERIKKQAGEEETGEAAEDEGFSVDKLRANITWLKQVNDDVVGWIYVEDTTINYPLMRSTNGDDDYYLTHAYNGEYLSVGSIYMVSSCDPVPKNNYNTLIYGHNVVGGGMFHDVMKFLEQDFFDSHLIYIYTLDGVYVYQPFSLYKTTSDYKYIQTQFFSEEEYLAYAAEMKSNSSLYSDLSIASGDTMITLSTCTGTGVVSSARYSLHAKLIDFIGG